MAVPNGNANGNAEVPVEAATSNIPPVVGINFGNSYASIAVFTKEGLAECIANEDGERQIACAVSYHGEEVYIGNPAKQQLVKNAKNTIVGFRNLLGKSFSEIPQNSQSGASAPVVQHPDQADVPAYTVDILLPAPTKPIATPSVRSPLQSATATPAGATPISEPVPSTKTLSVSEVTTLFLQSLIQSAEDFMGKKVQGAVITCPASFTATQREALKKAAEDAGIAVLQLLDEAGAVSVTTGSDLWTTSSEVKADRTQLIVDLGSSSLSLSLLRTSHGLAHVLAESHSSDIGADKIDDALIKFFATEFTKKTKVPLSVSASSTDKQDQRAEAKLRLAAEHTKRTLSASPSANCSVESLKDGMDFTGTINRLRFDMLARPVYTAVSNAVSDLLKSANVDPVFVDEIVYVGGTTALPGLDESLVGAAGFSEDDLVTPFSAGTLVGGGIGDPTTILSRGCAVQAALISSLSSEDEDFKAHFVQETEVKATSKSISLVFPSEGDENIVELIGQDTPLPARRDLLIDLTLSPSSAFAFEVYETTNSVRIEKVKPPKPVYSDDEDAAADEEEEEEEIEEKHKEVKKETLLAAAQGEAKLATAGKTKIRVTAVVSSDSKLSLWYEEEGRDGEKGEKITAAP